MNLWGMPERESVLNVNQLVKTLAILFESNWRKEAMQFCRDLYQCSQFLRGYHHLENPKGETKVAARLLDISRNCIYSKLKELQLAPEDFREAQTLDEVLAKSSVMRAKATQFESIKQDQRATNNLDDSSAVSNNKDVHSYGASNHSL